MKRVDPVKIMTTARAALALFFFALILFAATGVRAATDVTVACPGQTRLGAPFAVRLTSVKPLSGVEVSWQGRDVPAPVSSWAGKDVAVALLGSDVIKVKPGKHQVRIKALVDGDEREWTRTVRVKAKKYPEQRFKLPPKMVTPPKETLDRIARERKIIKKTLKTVTPVRHWKAPLQLPVQGRISSIYGLKRVLNGKPRSPHRGIDYAVGMGTPIKSVETGRVALVGDHYYAGRSVYVDHGLGVYSLYFHLSEVDVAEGDMVERGQILGRSGKSGRATGPHLHFSLSIMYQLVDPAPLFRENIDKLLAG